MTPKLLHTFFISNTFISNQTEISKNQANAKQHPETELLLFENYSHSLSVLSSKNNSPYFIKLAKEEDAHKNEDENEK